MSKINLDRADKLPSLMFEDVTVNPDADAPESSRLSGSNSTTLDIGVKAENTQFSSTPEIPISRNEADSPIFNPMQSQGVKAGSAISGKTAVTLINILLPSIAVLAINALGYRVDKRMLELTPDERRAIEPAMQDYLNSINVNFNNPLNNLMFVIGTVYAAKFMEVAPGLQKKERAQSKPAQGSGKRPVNVVEALIQRTAKERKQNREKALEYLLKSGAIVETTEGFKIA